MNALPVEGVNWKVLKTVTDTFGNNFSDEGRLPGSVFLLGDFLLFFIVNACYEEMSSEREAWGTGKNVLTLPFSLGVVYGQNCFWVSKQRLKLFVSLGFMASVCWDTSPFSASSVLLTAWYHYPRVSGREELLQNMFSKTAASGFESQCHHQLVVWTSANYSTSPGLSKGVPTSLMTVPILEWLWVNTYLSLRVMTDVQMCSLLAAVVNNDNSKTT